MVVPFVRSQLRYHEAKFGSTTPAQLGKTDARVESSSRRLVEDALGDSSSYGAFMSSPHSRTLTTPHYAVRGGRSINGCLPMSNTRREPSKHRVRAILWFVPFLLCGCLDARESPTPVEIVAERPEEECWSFDEVGAAPLPQPSAFTQLTLDQERELPCRVVAVQLPLQLRPSLDGTRPDPFWYTLAEDSQGRIYSGGTPQTGHSTVLVWTPDGQFEGTLGRPGQGPGELSVRGILGLFAVGRGDSLFVKDDARWSVFDGSHRFARVISGAAIRVRDGRRSTRLLPTGEFLIAEPASGGAADRWFHIADAEGNWLRSFGPKQASSSPQGRYRALAFDGDSTFWAAPPNGAPDGYVLEQWTTGGRLLRTIGRDVGWLEDARVDQPGQQPLPVFDRLILDDRGLLWIAMAVKDPRWVPTPPDQPLSARALEHERLDVRYEVIDPVRGRVLASGWVERPDSAAPLVPVFPGSRLEYARVTDSLGLETLQFYELFLLPQDR